MPFVLDASAALPWCFADETTSASIALLSRLKDGDQATVPAHWPAEMLSALLQGKRRNRIDDVGITDSLDNLASLPIHIDKAISLLELRGLKELASAMQLNAYDAIYLALALRESLSLATNDSALKRACISSGVPLL